MITDSYIEKNGKQIKKVSLLFVDEEKRLCDGCNEKKECASINDITDNVMVICKDCLQEIINAFY